MSKIVVLDNVEHKDLKVQIHHSEEFGDNINQALVFPTEFMELQREYPIFFRKSPEGDFYAVVLLGLDREENLFLNSDGWQARYVPAIQDRGPFSIALHERQIDGVRHVEPIINIDLEHPRLSGDMGENVFLPQGGNSPYLQQVSQVLQRIHVGANAAKAFFSELDALGLIEPIALDISLSDTAKYTVPDVFTISKEKIISLSGDDLAKLNSLGLLEHCFAVMSSAGNVSRLIELKTIKNAQTV